MRLRVQVQHENNSVHGCIGIVLDVFYLLLGTCACTRNIPSTGNHVSWAKFARCFLNSATYYGCRLTEVYAAVRTTDRTCSNIDGIGAR